MEINKEEALKAKDIAEERFAEKDFPGARSYALKAKTLWPGLDGISQMVATFEVYLASAVRVNGEVDYYSILGLKPSADRSSVKKQYKKLAVLLHPDKNKCVGADGAFKLISEAWTLLSDSTRKGSYDLKRSHHVVSHAAGVTSHNNCYNSSAPQSLDTFWTVCTSCKVQYEYLRKYVNKRLSCKNCRGIFIAVETGAAPVSGAFPYCPYTYMPSNGYAKSEEVPYIPNSATYYPGNGLHSGQGFEYGSNVSFQWSSNGSSSMAAPVSLSNGKSHRGNKDRSSNRNTRGRHSTKSFSPPSNGLCLTKSGRPDKRRKVTVGTDFRNGPEIKHSPESQSNGGHDPKVSIPIEQLTRRCSAAPLFDARKLLIDKARSEICKKLKFLKVAVKEEEKEVGQVNGGDKEVTQKGHSRPRSGPVSITVPDPDFHDFDKDRTEECFKAKQIWALYDEEDGMPRLYCLIREIISTNPFKILVTYLSSKSDSEFGAVNWLDCGFTKSCGNFRAFNSEVIEQVNIFSHVLNKEKAGRGGCIRLYPKSGDIWAVYRNWSPNWDRSTPPEVRHQYEMVEVVDDYSEELGVCVTPLVKMLGYKTVYQRDKDSVRWIPRREMLRFSHQVPSCCLKPDVHGLPDGSWDLDPAATPDELLHEGIEAEGIEAEGIEV